MSRWLFQIELPLCEDWKAIELLRTTVLNCLTTLFSSQEYCEVIGMIVAELLENALKYGHWPAQAEQPSAFRLRVSGTDDEVEVVVSNPVDPLSPNLTKLLDLVKTFESGATAEEIYQERMRAVAADHSATGGLGLARISYESSCRVSAQLSAEGILEVKAVARPSGRG